MLRSLVPLLLLSLSLAAQPPHRTPSEDLLYFLVFGNDVHIHQADYPPALRTELSAHLRRFNAYRSKRTGIAKTGVWSMVHTTYILYERRLAAVSASPEAPALALAYVDELSPCYEWEGYHDCPESEAVFATKYQADHPDGPFSAYLPLLAAHRWICAAEGYDYEKQPVEAARCRKQHGEALAIALNSPAPLIRSAAQTLKTLGACRGPSR
ncbi:MAG: hypothetical protein IH602_24155 [Bryobacteraceae bacterium]|nr:hypothetical protein [Bryobacteraceae bacterium]